MPNRMQNSASHLFPVCLSTNRVLTVTVDYSEIVFSVANLIFYNCQRNVTIRFYVSGNPGCARFYMDFANDLFTKMDCSIYVLSHAEMTNGAPGPICDRKSILLHSQISQKSAILDELGLYDHPNLVIISHSIGALMMLHLMRSSVKMGIGLTPTVERMKTSPEGQKMSPYFNHWFYLPLVQLLFFLLSIIPESLRLKLLQVHS